MIVGVGVLALRRVNAQRQARLALPNLRNGIRDRLRNDNSYRPTNTTGSAAPLADIWDTIVPTVLNHDGTGPGPMELPVGHTGDPHTDFELLPEGNSR